MQEVEGSGPSPADGLRPNSGRVRLDSGGSHDGRVELAHVGSPDKESGCFVLPVKAAVGKAEVISVGDEAEISHSRPVYLMMPSSITEMSRALLVDVVVSASGSWASGASILLIARW